MNKDKQIYHNCIELAKQSPCQKKGFGSVLRLEGGVQFSAFNASNKATKSVCDKECIRFRLDSGTDSLIGSCFHSEELAIWSAINSYHNVNRALLYVAGVSKPDNIPLENKDPYFYCIRCATLMIIARLSGVHIWRNDEWVYLTSEEAYQSSLQYALKQKVVMDIP